MTAALRKVYEANLRATQAENTAAILATVHPKSPSRALVSRALSQLFARYDLRYQMLSFTYVGRDEDYAVARVKQKTTKVAGPAFRDNVLDCLQIFRKDGDGWKLWTSANLEITYVPGSD